MYCACSVIVHGVRSAVPLKTCDGYNEPTIPVTFCLKMTEEWPKWKHRFEQYRKASRLVDKDET